MSADPKPPKRIVDRRALTIARITEPACAACGRQVGSIHHIVPRGEGGDDVAGNLVGLCGSGTTGCHGAWHGNPYVVEHEQLAIGADPVTVVERRTADWVAWRIGRTIRTRPEIIRYVESKLGAEAGRSYLERRYYVKEV